MTLRAPKASRAFKGLEAPLAEGATLAGRNTAAGAPDLRGAMGRD